MLFLHVGKSLEEAAQYINFHLGLNGSAEPNTTPNGTSTSSPPESEVHSGEDTG